MEVIDLGRCGYQEALELQKKILEERVQEKRPDTLILVEHQPIYTVGRAMSQSQNYPSSVTVPGLGEVPVVAVDRGGKMTWHGPGQITGYPIFHLAHRDIRRYLRDMEKVMAKAVAAVGLTGRPTPESLELEPGQLETGLWIGDHKVASIGVHIKHWVSYHGFALNVHPDMRYFNAIEPCGFKGDVMSSLLLEMGVDAAVGPVLMNDTKAALVEGFQKLANYYKDVTAQRRASAAASVVLGEGVDGEALV
jgi:lipoate-protein ligase B